MSVSGGIAFSSISAGLWATCGVAVSGDGYCWGLNGFDNLGTGSPDYTTGPTMIAGGLTFDAVVHGAGHACGLTGEMTYCWGARLEVLNWGTLGNGSFTMGSDVPTPVLGGLAFASVVPSSANNIYTFTCGISRGGDGYCWAAGRRGGLGTTAATATGESPIGTFWPCNAVPLPIASSQTFRAIATGGEFACAVGRNRATYCWGANDAGQLGDGSFLDQSTPVKVLDPGERGRGNAASDGSIASVMP